MFLYLETVSEMEDENMPDEEPAVEPNEESEIPNDDNEEVSSETTMKSIEELEKQSEREEDTENRRPSSRESVASTTSSSSERVLMVRSASEVNLTVPSASDVTVKTEKVPDGGSEKVEKSSISIVNPTQLGITSNTAGENLLQNTSYVPAGDQLISYMQPTLQNGGVPIQVNFCAYIKFLASQFTKYNFVPTKNSFSALFLVKNILYNSIKK